MKRGETLVHKRLKQEVARELRSKGYNVELEKTIGHRRVDVYAENEREIRIVEIIHAHDVVFPQLESEKPVKKTKIYTLDHFSGSRVIIVNFSYKPKDAWLVKFYKKWAKDLDISFSELVFRAIEEYRNNTVLIPIQKDVEELMRFYRGDLSYSEFIRGLIKSCVGV